MRSARCILIPLVVVLLVPLFSHPALADGISGLLDYNYTNTTIKTTDITGLTSKTRSYSLQQRYSLAFDKMIYPSIIFSGGGLYEDNYVNGNTDGMETKSATGRFSPYADLKLSNPFLTTGIGFRRREDSTQTTGALQPVWSKETQIQDTYTANLGWHPAELPSFDLFYTRRYLYDPEKTNQNIQTENYTWTVNYREIKGLEVNYSGNLSSVADRLANTDTENLTNSGRLSYTGSLLNNRVLYHASYNIAVQNTTITAKGTGGGTFYQPLPTVGSQLFAVTPNNAVIPPTTVTDGVLSAFSTSPNLVGVNPLGTQNNIGLSFSTPTQMQTIFLPVISKLDTSVSPAVRRPPTVADLNAFFLANPAVFSFKIYTSTSVDGRFWGPLGGIAPTSVTVGNNPANPTSDEVGFIITFPTQNTSFIKVVQTPPPAPLISVLPSIDPSSILVANIQAFRTVQITAPGTTGSSLKSSSIGGIYDMDVKALLLDNPNLAYDMSFSFNHNETDQTAMTTSYLINNGLSLAHRFTDILAMSARVTDEYSSDSQGRTRNAITYNAALNATPLPTLNHSLVYGGRVEFLQGETSLTNSIYLNNSAELYKGLSVNLGAGYNISSLGSGQNTDSVSITVGTDIVPNRDITLSLSYQDLMSHQSGGGQPDKSSYNRSVTASATYRPFEAIYLSAGYSVNMQNDRPTVTLQNYAVSWSPFRGGDLQFSFAYSQNYNSSENEKDTNISPSLRWNIRPGSTLDVYYNILKNTNSSTGTIAGNSLGARLRIAF